jgi:hypothetical protein
MLRGGCVALGVALAVVVAPAADAASPRYASPNGTGPPSGVDACPESNPCGLIPAIGNASVVDGDTVLLLPGTYNLGSNFGVVLDAITVRPRDPGTRPVLTTTSDEAVLEVFDNALVQDLKLVHNISTGTGTDGSLLLQAPGAVGERIVVETTTSRPGPSDGVIACQVNDGTLRDSTCWVHAVGSNTPGVAAAAFTAVAGTHSPHFVNVTAMGASTGAMAGTYGLEVATNDAGVAINATAHNVIARRSGTGLNVLVGGSGGGTASLTFTNSNYPDTSGGGPVTPAGTGTNQTAAPLLANPDAGDLRQLPGSPTIDAGAPDSLLGTQDFEFQARSQGGAPDIGADEFRVPQTPAITASDPGPPANDNNPEVKGTAEAGSTVKVFSTGDCAGSPVGTGTATEFATTGITATVPDDSTTELRATAADVQGHISACSDPFPYTEDSTAPASPQIVASSPPSPADDNDPEVFGTAEAGSTVRLFGLAECLGAPLASGGAAEFSTAGLTIGVADDTTTTVRATATDAAGNASGCSSPFTFVEATPPQTSIDSAPKAIVRTRKRKAPFEIRFSASEDATFLCSLDGAPATHCSSPVSGKVRKGLHSFQVAATDAVGNEDASPAQAAWKVKRKKRRR